MAFRLEMAEIALFLYPYRGTYFNYLRTIGGGGSAKCVQMRTEGRGSVIHVCMYAISLIDSTIIKFFKAD